MILLDIKNLALLVCSTFLVIVASGCMLTTRGQRYQDFVTKTPLPEKGTLVIGFVGGREDWNNEKERTRRLALILRSMNLPNLSVETVENKRRFLALSLIQNAFDRDRNGVLDATESGSARVILYGQSFGGAAVIKLARELESRKIPVLMTVQIDSVGRNDDSIPANVLQAANLFQKNGKIIRGEPFIRAEDPLKTRIIGNFEFDYRNRKIDLSAVPWWKKIFRKAHTSMNLDPEVWDQVKRLILGSLASP